jgi:hypothetical protein
MEMNVGDLDRVLRIILGIALIGTGLLACWFVPESAMRWLGALGLIPLATGLSGFSPLYRLLGINTCELLRDNA